MNILTQGLPDKVYLGGLEYTINTDFRIYVDFERILLEKRLTDEEKIKQIVRLVYGEVYIENYFEAMDKAIEFYCLGKSLNKKINETEETKQMTKIFDYEQDSGYIFAAFLETYNINLITEDLHWWLFKYLIESLPEDCKLSKIMSYRAIKINSEMSKNEKSFYRKMKNIYRLENDKTAQEKEEEFANILGGL